MIWGIDPGVNGALALFDPIKGTLHVEDIKTVKINNRKDIVPSLLCDQLKQQHCPIYIEHVGSMPGNSGRSMFTFGKTYGVILGVAAGLQMPVTTVTPQVWMRKVGKKKGKEGSRQRAFQLFPAYASSFARVKDHDRADAALIAYYGFTFGESVER